MNTSNIITKRIIEPPRESAATHERALPNTQDSPRSTQDSPRTRWLTMATNDVDRAGDILDLSGMDATNFLKNPQFLWQHGKSGAQVNTIGKVLQLRVVGGTLATQSLQALVEYAPADINPLAEQIYQLDLLGLLPANSIGFRPIEWHANDFGGNTFTKWELIECSKVELPMNPSAVDSGKCIEESVETKGQFIDPDQRALFSVDDAADWLHQRPS